MLAAGRFGGLRRAALTGSSTSLPSIPVYCEGDRGLLGLVVRAVSHRSWSR
jgi:hypothetical protein